MDVSVIIPQGKNSNLDKDEVYLNHRDKFTIVVKNYLDVDFFTTVKYEENAIKTFVLRAKETIEIARENLIFFKKGSIEASAADLFSLNDLSHGVLTLDFISDALKIKIKKIKRIKCPN